MSRRTRLLLNGTVAALLLLQGSVAAAADQPQVAVDPAPVITGSGYYALYCAVCHGSDARGGGPLAATLSIAPPNLRRMAVFAGNQFPADRVRQHIDGREFNPAHGSREMPVWGSVFKRARGSYGERRVGERLDKLVDYLRRIQDVE